MIDLSSSWEKNALLKSSASLYVSSNGKAREFCYGRNLVRDLPDQNCARGLRRQHSLPLNSL
jgi:hypothetical protein